MYQRRNFVEYVNMIVERNPGRLRNLDHGERFLNHLSLLSAIGALAQIKGLTLIFSNMLFRNDKSGGFGIAGVRLLSRSSLSSCKRDYRVIPRRDTYYDFCLLCLI